MDANRGVNGLRGGMTQEEVSGRTEQGVMVRHASFRRLSCAFMVSFSLPLAVAGFIALRRRLAVPGLWVNPPFFLLLHFYFFGLLDFANTNFFGGLSPLSLCLLFLVKEGNNGCDDTVTEWEVGGGTMVAGGSSPGKAGISWGTSSGGKALSATLTGNL